MATYRVTSPSGATYEIEAPDGANEQAVFDMVRRQEGLASGAPVQKGPDIVRGAPKKPGLIDPDKGVLGGFANALASIPEGVAALPDMLAEGLGSALGYGAQALGAPDWISEGLKNPLTVQDAVRSVVPFPEGSNAQFARNVGGGLFGAGAGVRTGASLLKNGATELSRRVGADLAYRAKGQIAAAGTGTAAADIARQGGAPAPVQAGLGIAVGSLTPSAARGALEAFDAGIDRLSPAGAQRTAARILRDNIATSEYDVLRNIDTMRPSVSGAHPTLAEVSLDPGVAGLQRAFGNVSVRDGAGLTTRLDDNARKRLAALDANIGPGDIDALPQGARNQMNILDDNIGRSFDRVGPLMPPEVAGQQARQALSDEYGFAKAKTRAAYSNPALDDNPAIRLRPFELDEVAMPSPAMPVDIEGFQDEAVKGMMGRLPPRPKSLAQFIRQQGGVAPDSMGADDLRASGFDARGDPGFVNSRGRSLDDVRAAAAEQGYVPADIDLADFTEMLRAEKLGGAARYADPDAARQYNQAKANRDWWRQQFDESGRDPTKMTDADWLEFYDRINGGGDTPRTGDDLAMQSMPGKVMGPFQLTIASLRDRFFGENGEELPAYARSFFNEVIDADSASLKTIEAWERKAADLASNAPDRQTAAFMQTMRRAIGARAATEGGPERRAALQSARGARSEQGRVYEDGPVGNVLAREDYGRFRLPESQVGRALIQPGRTGGEAAGKLIEAAPNDALGIARAELRQALESAGNDPRAVARVSAQYRQVASQFPDLDTDLRAARETAAAAALFRRSPYGRMLDANNDPAEVVSRLLSVRDGGRSLRTLIGQASSPTVLGGVRRALASDIESRALTSAVDSGLQTIPSNAKMLDAVGNVLDRTAGTAVFTSPQRAALNSIRREMRKDQFARSANRTSGSDTARNAGVAMDVWTKLAVDVMPNIGGAKQLLQVLGTLAGDASNVRLIVSEAMLDPKFAAELLRRPTPDRVERALRRMRSLNVNPPVAVSGSVSEDD